MLDKCISLVNTYRFTQVKVCHAHFTFRISVSLCCLHISISLCPFSDFPCYSFVILNHILFYSGIHHFLYPCRGYYDFSQKFRLHKVYIFLISITKRVDLAMSACPSVSTQTSLSVSRAETFPKVFFLLQVVHSCHRKNRKKNFKNLFVLFFFNI